MFPVDKENMHVTDLDVSSITVEPRQERPLNNLDKLIASIQDIGLLHPIVVGTDGRLKVGYRRLKTYEQMGRATIPAHVTDNLDEHKKQIYETTYYAHGG